MSAAEQPFLSEQSRGLHLHPAGAVIAPSGLAGLTQRDISVLRLLADGQSTAAIAADLAYSDSTIKNVIRELVHQMGARNRAHAVAMAIRAGLI